MSTTTHQRVTAADYRAMPEPGPRYQLIDGALHLMSPAPTSRHQRVVFKLARMLAAFVEPRRLGEVFVSPIDVYLGEHDVFQPDIVFVSTERAKRVVREGIRGAPDLVVEVLSPSTRRIDLKEKRRVYAREGVREAVYVDLELDEVTVFRFEGGAVASERRIERGGRYETDLLPGFAAAIDDMIGPPELPA